MESIYFLPEEINGDGRITEKKWTVIDFIEPKTRREPSM